MIRGAPLQDLHVVVCIQPEHSSQAKSCYNYTPSLWGPERIFASIMSLIRNGYVTEKEKEKNARKTSAGIRTQDPRSGAYLLGQIYSGVH